MRGWNRIVAAAAICWTICSCSVYTPDENGVEVYALCDYLHNGVMIVRRGDGGTNRFYFYSFIEVNYYLHGNRDMDDLLAALFTETESAVEVGYGEGPYEIEDIFGSLSFVGVPSGWLFRFSEEKIARGIRFIDEVMLDGKKESVGNWYSPRMTYAYYRSARAWTALYNCGSFTADVLSKMGAPLDAGWYTYNNELLRIQLDAIKKQETFDTNR